MKTLATLAAIVMTIIVAGPTHAALIQPGEPFPSWSLRDHEGQVVTSEELAGKRYLLWFYPAAMTPGCTAEGLALRDTHERFAAEGVEILGVSFDEPEKNARFVKTHAFPYRLLTADSETAMEVGATSSPQQKYARRISYLVGEDGRVLRSYGTVMPSSHADQVLSDLKM